MRTLPLAEAKAKLSGLVDTVARRDERVTITKRGRPTAVLMSYDDAAGLEATLEIMSDPDFYAEILRNQKALDRGEGRVYDLDELFGEEDTPARAKGKVRAAARGQRLPPPAAAGAKKKGARGDRRAPKRSGSR